jgi:hypothetical protein
MGQNFCGLWWDQDCELKEIPISGISTGYVRSH